ncbi:MAG: hypothetical protein AMJ46_02525 [Latescibacteria bacterium DG_63]|nr:MAG: hypothetical protein AMJ46_02525 [Latescibacteria bacterium DG_63]
MAPDSYRILKRNLSLARRVLARGSVGLWLLRALCLALAILFLSTAVVLAIGSESSFTPVLGVLAVFGIPILVIAAVVYALLRLPSLERIAVMADRLVPGRKNALISSLQLGERIDELSTFYSGAVMEAVVREGAALSETLQSRELTPVRKLRSWSAGLVVCAAALAGLLIFVPGAFEPSFSSLVQSPFAERVSLSVEPGNVEIESGEDVPVTVSVSRSLSEPRLRVSSDSRPPLYLDMERSGKSGVFEALIEGVEFTTEYAAELGRVESPAFTISVRTPPQISEFVIAYKYPDYTGIERRVVGTVVGDVFALKGTAVWLEVTFTRQVSSADLLFDDGTTVSMQPRSEKSLSAGLTLRREGTYQVSAEDRVGKRHLSPPYSVHYQEDLDPFLKVVSPLPEADLPEDMELPLEVICADDYGLSTLNIHYYVNPNEVRTEEITSFEDRTREIALTHYWDLGPLQLLPGEIVTYFLEVFDNDAVSGPKSTRTPLMTVRFPTLAELYADMEEQHGERIVKLEEILEEAELLRTELETVRRELKQESQVSWERKKQMEGLWTAYDRMAESLDDVNYTLEESVGQLESYDPMSWELAEKILEVRKLLEELQSPELKSAIQRLQEALANLDIPEMEAALADYSISQEELLKGLDRAIELLKQIRFDEKLQAALEEAANLAEAEAEIDRQLDEKDADLLDAANRQECVGKSLEQLKKQLDELRQEASEAGEEELSEMLQEMSRSVGEGGLLDMVSQSMVMMRTERTPALRRLVRNIESGLRQLADDMARAQACSASGRLADVTEKVRRAMHELLSLSKAQEELAMCTGREPAQDLAVRQHTIHEGTSVVADRLLDISKETFFMTHQTAAQLGLTLREMEEALRNFENKRVGLGVESSRVAYQGLNNVLKSLLVAEQSMCGAQGGMGIGQGLRRMRSLSGLQRSINRTTETLYSSLDRQGRLSHSEEEVLGRLAAQQEMVRKGMEEVSRALGERRDILGRLEEIIEEMRQVETHMEARQLDEDTVRRQHRIMSRLLDAQKSIQQRDYTGKRYSRPGRDFPERESPPELSRELLGEAERVKLDILRERTVNYPEAYRELVEQYLRALSEGSEK